MKIRLLGCLAGLTALAAAVSPGCSQPKPECTVGSATSYPFAAKLILVDGDPESSCAQLKGLTLGMQTYNPNSGGYPDPDTKLVAIQTDLAEWSGGGTTLEDSPDRNTYAIGAFTSIEPDGNDICRIPQLSPAELVLVPEQGEGGAGGGAGGGDGGAGGGDGGAGGAGGGAGGAGGGAGGAGGGAGGAGGGAGGAGGGDGGAGGGAGGAGGGDGGAGGAGGGDGGAGGGAGGAGGGAGGAGGDAPADERTSMKYEWSNMEVYVTAANLGNQFQADLSYSDDTCTAKYRVIGLWPQVHCEKLVEEEVLNPETEEMELTVVGTGEPEDKLCDNIPDPEAPYYLPVASGIAADLKVKCDPELLVCVLDADKIPALK
ncbi:hypothetical protein [Sorangium sp. So ce1099]|uniref:hypothetical protein n=1 Tax=Sorangium sp. So ce1099 TaxID=3133331 RepID=UPI003F62D3CE